MPSKRIHGREWESKMIALRKKYAPRKQFDLVSYSKELKKSLANLDCISNTLREESNDQKNLIRLLQLENKRTKLISKISPKIKHDIDLFYRNGNKINTNALTRISIPKDESIFSIYYSMTNILYNSCYLFIRATKRKKNSRNYRYSKSQFCICSLIRAFHKMTGELPECTNDRNLEKGDEGYDEYQGNFYDFLLELNPILKEAFNINLGTNKVIGKYANNLIKQYKEEISF
jgi:hypothetical protein